MPALRPGWSWCQDVSSPASFEALNLTLGIRYHLGLWVSAPPGPSSLSKGWSHLLHCWQAEMTVKGVLYTEQSPGGLVSVGEVQAVADPGFRTACFSWALPRLGLTQAGLWPCLIGVCGISSPLCCLSPWDGSHLPRDSLFRALMGDTQPATPPSFLPSAAGFQDFLLPVLEVDAAQTLCRVG